MDFNKKVGIGLIVLGLGVLVAHLFGLFEAEEIVQSCSASDMWNKLC